MADVHCRHCGEPWDLYCIHDRVAELNDGLSDSELSTGGATFTSVSADFRRQGCIALGGPCPTPAVADLLADALADLLGDDMDGQAAEYADLSRDPWDFTQAAPKVRRPRPVSRISPDQGALL